MWIFSYDDGNSGYKKWLQPNNVYQLGRSSEKQSVPNFIYFSQIYISKEHFQIDVRSISEGDIFDCELKTPLFIKFQSRAITKINDDKIKLRKDQSPFVVDFSHQNKMYITFKEEKALSVTIEWIPFNVARYTKQIMVSGVLSFNPLTDELLKLFRKGIDLRIAKHVDGATHYVTVSDQVNHGLKVSLSKGIPILNTDWTDFILENMNNFEKWFLHLDPKNFLPFSKKDNSYLMPNNNRSGLLRGYLVIIFHDNKDKLLKWIRSLGGKVLKVNISEYIQNNELDKSLVELIKNKISEYNSKSCLLMGLQNLEIKNGDTVNELLSKFANNHDSVLISEAMLYDAVINVSTNNLQTFDVNKDIKRTQSPVQTETSQPRKRRKFKKVGVTDFFDFKPPVKIEIGSMTDSNHVKESPTIGNQENIIFPEEDPKGADDEPKVNTVENDIMKESPKLDKRKRTHNTSEIAQDNVKEEPEVKKIKVGKTGKFIPQVSLLDAIRSTKQMATDNIRDELGIKEQKENGDQLDEKLHDLAIVETININFRRSNTGAVETENSLYKDRKNFKTFKKTLKLNDSRSFIDLQPTYANNNLNSNTIESNGQDREIINKQTQLNNDFTGIMDDISGYKPNIIELDDDDLDNFSSQNRNQTPQESLFVPEESQRDSSNSERIRIDEEEKNDDDDGDDDDNDDDDDDDDDDQPKFAFSRT